jgi:hypothetical protein
MATMDDMINLISVCKNGAYKFRYKYPHLNQRYLLIKKVERYINSTSNLASLEQTRRDVIKALYDYLNPFNTCDKEKQLDYLKML